MEKLKRNLKKKNIFNHMLPIARMCLTTEIARIVNKEGYGNDLMCAPIKIIRACSP